MNGFGDPLGTRPDTPCREWRGRLNDNGYGTRRYDSKARPRRMLAHRWVWEQINGPIPPGMLVMHRCDNPACFRYDHLRLGTPSDNMYDKAMKGRSGRTYARATACVNGHPYPESARYHSGHAICKVCDATKQRERRAAKRASL